MQSGSLAHNVCCVQLIFNKMKVKELIELLKTQDLEKEVMIQQGEEYDYMKAYTVKEIEIVDMDDDADDDIINVVAIEYC